jgi:XrtN system VIT domain protein
MELLSYLRQGIVRLGIGLLSASFILYSLYELLPTFQADGMGMFMIHYACTVFYFFAVLFSGRFKTGRNRLPLVIINLLLFLISAFALNRQMDVFHQSAGWLQSLLIISGLNLLLASLALYLPVWLRYIQVFFLTIGMVLYAYLAIYLIPMFAFGILGVIAIGVGLHAFVPLLLFIYSLRVLKNQIYILPKAFIPVSMALGICFTIILSFSFYWGHLQQRIETAYHGATRPDKIGWPAWVEALQVLPESAISLRLLKSDIVYTVPDWKEGLSFFELPRIRWEEDKMHDPLVAIASLLSGKISIPKEDRIKMLQTLYDNRYRTEERLWNGSNLETVHLNTNVQIWPAMHLAYTEKTITVANNLPSNAWSGNQQEAIYIFQLPEGAVVTSLSLWINGVEEKSVLTTKGKAQNAYRTIVGVEARDPSVVHWLEGNRVSVRVFPVIAGEQRTFKLGITLPMAEREGNIWYENISFTGPGAQQATENVKVQIMESGKGIIQMVSLKKQQENMYTYSGKYDPAWSLAIPALPIARRAFVHGQNAFRIEAATSRKEPVTFAAIYVDINAAWTIEEWKTLMQQAGKKKVFVYDDGWVRIADENHMDIFEKLKHRKITLFPFYALPYAEKFLIVTKSGGRTPSLEDIRSSTGFAVLSRKAANGARFYVYHLGEKPSLYISSLRELRLFHYTQGSLNKLVQDLNQEVFDADLETNDQVIIHSAGMMISRSLEALESNGPDHLLRLFAYNYILQQGGIRLLTDSSLQDSKLDDLAAFAHIVTPVSSMLVLESKADYNRFDIDTGKMGLQNASTQNSGSVPEPHEWAIMIVCLLILAYFHYQQKMNLLWLKK